MIKPQLRKKREAEKATKITADLKVKQDADHAARQRIEQDEALRQDRRVSVEMHTQSLREMVQKDPRVVAMVVRDWMSNEL